MVGCEENVGDRVKLIIYCGLATFKHQKGIIIKEKIVKIIQITECV